MKKIFFIGTVFIILCVVVRLNAKGKHITNHIKGFVKTTIAKPSNINKEGATVKTRVLVPKSYTRVSYSKNSFQDYLQNYRLKEHGSPIINYDGTSYFAQHWHDAILEIPVPKNGLQQCADALIRIRAEYLWQQNRKSEIGFKFTSGHYCSWSKYAQGYRPKISGNKVSFHKTAKPNSSKTNFYKYLNLIFTYSGTASLYAELPKVKIKDIKVGDMLVKPGFPGHIEIIIDEAVNEKGEKIYVLAQGNTPAQNVCILKNFENDALSPWYTFTKEETIYTPSYYFEKPTFVRFK